MNIDNIITNVDLDQEGFTPQMQEMLEDEMDRYSGLSPGSAARMAYIAVRRIDPAFVNAGPCHLCGAEWEAVDAALARLRIAMGSNG